MWRRAAGRLRPGGKATLRGGRRRLLGCGEDRVAPEEADQRQVAVQPGPGAALVVAQPELLLAVLVEPLDGPPRVGRAHLRGERGPRPAPGEVPPRVVGLARQRALADQPALRPGPVAVGAVDPEPADAAPARATVAVEHRHRPPAPGR